MPIFNFNIQDIEPDVGGGNPNGNFEYIVTLTQPNINLLSYQGGGVSIAGEPSFTPEGSIDVINDQTFIIRTIDNNSQLKIPIEIRDNDDIPLNGTSNAIAPISFDESRASFGKVYIDVEEDGCGNINNNQNSISFARNVQDANANPNDVDTYSNATHETYSTDQLIRQSLGRAAPNYWCTYVLSGWQASTKIDADPEAEGFEFGVSHGARLHDCDQVRGGDFALLNHELLRTLSNAAVPLGGILAHELGHGFGLSHGIENAQNAGQTSNCLMVPGDNPAQMGLMTKGNLLLSDFISYHQNILRSRVFSPGTSN